MNAIAAKYAALGLKLIPVPYMKKAPTILAWQDREFPPQDFPTASNYGLKNGLNVVDVDCDSAEAIRLAADILPPTPAVFGRKSKPNSHYLYRVNDPQPTRRFQTPDGKAAIEFRSKGSQTIVPPSIHPSGERIEWQDGSDNVPEPATVDSEELYDAVKRIAKAAGCIVGEPIDNQTIYMPSPALTPAERCKAFLSKCPDAISGSAGHNATFLAACECYRFGLSDADAAGIMQWFNSTKCRPQWSEKEIAHKLANAKALVTAEGKIGFRLTESARAAGITFDPAALPITPSITPATETPDPDIIPIDQEILPEVPADALPEWAREYAHALSAAKETPPTLATLLITAAVASTVQRVFRVQVEPSYSEPLCIYACPALESGERKTAIFQPVVLPLFFVQQTLRAQVQTEIDTVKIESGLITAEIKRLQKQYFEEKNPAARDELLKQIKSKTAELPPIPALPQLVSEDSTEAALAVTLKNNQESQLVASDEGGFFDNLAGGRFNEVSEMDIFLKGYSGSPHTTNRIGRENLHLHRPLLSIAISPQPQVLAGIRDMDSFINRGGMARFCTALPASAVGNRSLIPGTIPEDIRRTYNENMVTLATMGRKFSEPEPKTLTLSEGAYLAWKDFEKELEPRMAKDGDLYPVKPWASKLAGCVARIAAVGHAGEYGETANLYSIPANRMHAAINFGKALIPHSLAVNRLMRGRGSNAARSVMDYYNAQGWPAGVRTLTEWWRPAPVRAIIGGSSKDFEPIAQTLADHGYLIPVEVMPARGGKRGAHYRANNRLFASSKFKSS